MPSVLIVLFLLSIHIYEKAHGFPTLAGKYRSRSTFLAGFDDRRSVMDDVGKIISLLVVNEMVQTSFPSLAFSESGAADPSNKYAPEFVQSYSDFTTTPEGWKYRDVKVGTGGVAINKGDRLVYDWSGYTIGYFGRPFEAKGGPQGGAFDKDIDYFRTVVGSNTIVPALEKAMLTMKPGGIRQVLVPYGPESYPADDLEHTRVGPKPTTFSGQRALNFVLENPRLDRTLLFNVKLVRVDKGTEKGGFTRGSI